jgi:hypothetical protein
MLRRAAVFAVRRASSAAASLPAPKMSKKEKILGLNQKLLDYIAAGDWAGYASLCDPSLTCFEAEARGAFVEGLDFHKIYYSHESAPGETRKATMSAPHVRFLGERAAVLSYVRLVQKYSEGKGHSTLRVEETRVWERSKDAWRLVHFHKSDLLK